LKVCHSPVVSFGSPHMTLVVSCMIETGSESRIVVVVGCMIGTEIGSSSGHIGLMVEDCMMCDRFRWVGTRLAVLTLSIHPAAHYEKNTRRHFPARNHQ
jgi:hypothetical protein